MVDLTVEEQKNWVISHMPHWLNVASVKLFFCADTAFSFCGIVDDLPRPVSDTVYPPPCYHNQKTSSIRHHRSIGEIGDFIS
jgi:hypothetical protein